jgi:fructokinase
MSEEAFSPINGRPVIFGEVLFDTFPDGREVLGGAPFNVARHLQGFGFEPLFISRVGDDERGRRVQEAMQEWGMDMSGLQVDPHHPTGIVKIAMQGTSHTFDILPEQAYDYIDAEQALHQLHNNEVGLLYFGSLIERSSVSRETLRTLRSQSLPLFVDINLRAPWWTREGVASLLHGVDWVKLNDEELEALGFGGALSSAAAKMREQYGFEMLVVTRGEDGALFVTQKEMEQGEPVRVENLVDTVGAGDAFSSVTLLGLLRGWDMRMTLKHALEFAAHLCEVRGAVLPDRSYYQRCLSEWQ